MRRRCLIVNTVLLAASGGVSSGAWGRDIKQSLAPAGILRVGVYLGNPTSMVKDPVTGEPRGVCLDLGVALAHRLGVPFQRVDFVRVADVLQAMKAGEVDLTLSNATPARAQDVAFTQTLLSLELGYLVPGGSPIDDLAAVDRPGVRIGVSQGSTSQRVLPRRLRQATVVVAPSLEEAVRMFAAQQLDAYATNKAILFEMADKMPGAHVLDGSWGLEHLAFALPQGHRDALDYMRMFVAEVQTDGELDRALERSGLRGAAPAG